MPLEWVSVEVYSSSGYQGLYTNTDEDGFYRVSCLPRVTIMHVTPDDWNGPCYPDKWYQDADRCVMVIILRFM